MYVPRGGEGDNPLEVTKIKNLDETEKDLNRQTNIQINRYCEESNRIDHRERI